MKKFLSMALAAAMTMSLATVAAGATSFTDDASIDNKEAVGVLSAVGVLNGMTDGSYAPDGILTREQAAKIIAYAVLGQKAADKLGVESAPFADVAANRWSAPFVSYCVNEGIVAGVGGNKFAPEAQLTGYQFAKMVLVAMGYDAAVEGMTGNSWSIAVAKLVDKKDLDEDIDAALSAPLTRQFAAQMLLNAAGQAVVDYDTKGTSISINGATIATGASKAEDVTKTVNGVQVAVTFMEEMEAFDGVKVDATIVTDAFGRKATAWSHKDWDGKLVFADAADYTIVVKEADKLSDILEDNGLEWDDIKVVGHTDKTEAIAAGTVLELTETDNDDEYTMISYTYDLVKVSDDAEACDKDDDKDAIKKGAAYKVETAEGTLYDIQLPGVDVKSLEDGDYLAVAKVGSAFAKDTVSLKGYDIYTASAAKVVTGKVSTMKAGKYAVVDGTKYMLAAGVTVEAGTKYDLTLDVNGMVLKAVKASNEAIALDEVYVLRAINVDSSTSYGKDTTKVTAQLVALDGSVKEVQLENYDENKKYLSDTLVTLTDDEEICGSEEDNDKFDLKKWDNDTTAGFTDGDYTSKKTIYTQAGASFKDDASRVTMDGKLYRVNSATKFVFVEDKASDIEITTKTGAVNYNIKATDTVITVTEEGSNTLLYVIVMNDTEIKMADKASEDYVFVKEAASEVGKKFAVQTVYMADGTEKEWKTDKAYTQGFYTYEAVADEDYEYKLKLDATALIVTNNVWDDEEGVLVGATIGEDALYGTLLTVGTIADIETKDAKFVDLHDEDAVGAYSKSVSSLSALCDLIDDGKVANVKVNMNVGEDGATVIFLMNADAAKK